MKKHKEPITVECCCSECEHIEHEGRQTILCGKTGRRMEKDDFCKYAKRKEHDETGE